MYHHNTFSPLLEISKCKCPTAGLLNSKINADLFSDIIVYLSQPSPLRYLNVIPWIGQTLPQIYGCTASIVKHSWLLINTKSSPTYLRSPCRIPPAIHHCRATKVATLQFLLNTSLLFISCFLLPLFTEVTKITAKQYFFFSLFLGLRVLTKLCLLDQLQVYFYICLQ